MRKFPSPCSATPGEQGGIYSDLHEIGLKPGEQGGIFTKGEGVFSKNQPKAEKIQCVFEILCDCPGFFMDFFRIRFLRKNNIPLLFPVILLVIDGAMQT